MVDAQGGPGTNGDQAAVVRARKAALRRAIRVACDDLSGADLAIASAAAEERLRRLPELRSARTVALYAAHRREIDLTGLAVRCRERGVRTAFPRVVGDDLHLAVVTEVAALAPGYRGIAEPSGPLLPLDEVDAVVAPGIAFDPTGGRLGRGGGHYDRLLARLPASTLRIGVGAACQVVPVVPREPHDAVLDLVVTDRATYRTGARPLAGA